MIVLFTYNVTAAITPTSSLHCRLLGIFWNAKNQLIAYAYSSFVTKCIIWLEYRLTQGTSLLLLGKTAENVYHAQRPEHGK